MTPTTDTEARLAEIAGLVATVAPVVRRASDGLLAGEVSLEKRGVAKVCAG
jgi:hypothetical protein